MLFDIDCFRWKFFCLECVDNLDDFVCNGICCLGGWGFNMWSVSYVCGEFDLVEGCIFFFGFMFEDIGSEMKFVCLYMIFYCCCVDEFFVWCVNDDCVFFGMG